MRNEQNEQNEQNKQDATQSPVSPNEGPPQLQVGRLLLALAICALIIVATLIYEKFG